MPRSAITVPMGPACMQIQTATGISIPPQLVYLLPNAKLLAANPAPVMHRSGLCKIAMFNVAYLECSVPTALDANAL